MKTNALGFFKNQLVSTGGHFLKVKCIQLNMASCTCSMEGGLYPMALMRNARRLESMTNLERGGIWLSSRQGGWDGALFLKIQTRPVSFDGEMFLEPEKALRSGWYVPFAISKKRNHIFSWLVGPTVSITLESLLLHAFIRIQQSVLGA